MKTLSSLSTIAPMDVERAKAFGEIFADFFLDTGLNPEIFFPIGRVLVNMAYGTGFGKIVLFMEKGELVQIKPEESVLVKRSVLTSRGNE